MKTLYATLLIILAQSTCAQPTTDKIEVSYDKSSILVFEAAIKHKGWNCGLKELVGVSVLENKILLQSKEEHFEETNLIVELVDGTMYAFNLVYNNTPRQTFHVIRNTTALYAPKSSTSMPQPPSQSEKVVSKNPILLPLNSSPATGDRQLAAEKVATQNSQVVRPTALPATGNRQLATRNESPPVKDNTKRSPNTLAEQISSSPDYLKRIGLISHKMFLYIGGIYVFDEHIYFKVNLKNVSTIPYDIDYAQFLIKNRKSGLNKTSSAAAEPLAPILIHNCSGETINKDQIVTLVYVFKKFTISDDKKLLLEFWERNGDRSLELPVESIEILNAKNEL